MGLHDLITCGGGGGDGGTSGYALPTDIDKFPSSEDVPLTGPISYDINEGGDAWVHIYQPAPDADVQLTLFHQSSSVTVQGSISAQGIGRSAGGFLLGWLASHALDWALTHDINGNPFPTTITVIPNGPPPAGGYWFPTTITVPQGSGPPAGWSIVPANYSPTGQPVLPNPPEGCKPGWTVWDCVNAYGN